MLRYEPLLAPAYRYNKDGNVYPSSELVTSSDSALTALAQLAAYQTGTEHAYISLFDSAYQYILVETAPSMPIGPNLRSDQGAIPLALRGTAIPRDQGTCDHVLYLPNAENDAPGELPLSFVPNLGTDARFNSRPYCQFGEAGQFYAAVPIRTGRGINIAALCVTSLEPPAGWNDDSTARLREISRAVMEQLEFRRSKNASRIHEQMTRGIDSFINGQHSITSHSAQLGTEPELSLRKPPLDAVEINPVLDKASQQPSQHSAKSLESREYKFQAPKTPFREKDNIQVYSKAANIIREALDVEGCVFLDVTIGSFDPPVSSPIATAFDSNIQGSSSSSDEQATGLSPESPDAMCNVLGFSTKAEASVHGATFDGETGKTIPGKFLAKLLRRYPNGKIFHYDAAGAIQSSESSDDDELLESSLPDTTASFGPNPAKRVPKQRRRNKYSRANESALIQQTFPTARSVAFIPLWDSKRERWSAGGFIYTLTPTQQFSVDIELSFLRAFVKLMSAEILSLEALQSDKAKSDMLGSLSHELRSPLHGVLSSTELLNDTSLTAFQENIIHTMQSCCRTLLDTFDHLLDYSKINSFSEKRKRAEKSISSIPGPSRKHAKLGLLGEKSLYINTDIGLLVEEVAESVFAGFNFQNRSIRQLSKRFHSNLAKFRTQAPSNLSQAEQKLHTVYNDEDDQNMPSTDVSVYLSVDLACQWMFYAPSGAIRRIVMNLLGNALKYTRTGIIRITLTQEPDASYRRTKRSNITLVVHDTGKGIGQEFLKYKLFKPFSQEDELQPGTGLGLSLVKTIVSQLDGNVAIKSQVDVGTTVTVRLPLERQSPDDAAAPAADQSADSKVFHQQLQELRGLRVSLRGFESQTGSGGKAAVQDIAQRCLGLNSVEGGQTSPDLVIWSETALPQSINEVLKLSKAPNVVVCQDGLIAYQRSMVDWDATPYGTFEFISQPFVFPLMFFSTHSARSSQQNLTCIRLGPRKFAEAIIQALKRWTSQPNDRVSVQRPATLRRAQSAFDVTPPTEHRAFPLPIIASPAVESQKSSIAEPPKDKVTEGDEPEAKLPPNLSKVETTSSNQNPSRDAVELPKKIFLLVDDNQINLRILSAFMKKLDRDYVAVSDGKQAVDAYTSNPSVFAGILMDISMPVMDGLEATRLIRAHEFKTQLQAVAIVALTGLASESTHEEALQSGVDVFLTKPVSLKTLSKILTGLEEPCT